MLIISTLGHSAHNVDHVQVMFADQILRLERGLPSCNPNILGADQALELSKEEKMATTPSSRGLISSNDRSLSKKMLSLRKVIATRIQLINILNIASPLLAQLIAYQPQYSMLPS